MSRDIRKAILKQYKVQNGVIRTPGKFENEPVYAPYFYDLVMQGASDETDYDDDGTALDYFDITSDDIKQFPELKGIKRLQCYEDSAGFFYCVKSS